MQATIFAIAIAALCLYRSLSAPLPQAQSDIIHPCLSTRCTGRATLKNYTAVERSEKKLPIEKPLKAEAYAIVQNVFRPENTESPPARVEGEGTNSEKSFHTNTISNSLKYAEEGRDVVDQHSVMGLSGAGHAKRIDNREGTGEGDEGEFRAVEVGGQVASSRGGGKGTEIIPNVTRMKQRKSRIIRERRTQWWWLW